VPSLYSALTLGNNALNPAVYGTNANAEILERGQVVEIVLNNNDIGKHPFHLHGHKFQLVSRSDENAGNFVQNASTPAIPDMPMSRDTVTIRPGGNLRIRFVADNPGIWLFHCHIEWCVSIVLGMLSLTIAGTPSPASSQP
jgi:iron transport multicopper oxidase